MSRLAILTSRHDLDLHDDGPPLLAALADVGIEGVAVPWGSDPVLLEGFDGALVRTTWDYIDDRESFLAWADATATRIPLANPPAVLRWNTDKRYLRDLERRGVPVVPTMWIEPGERLGDVPWQRFVVKPSVSAGGRASASYTTDGLAQARAHVAAIVARGDAAMVQPHVAAVDVEGEVGTYLWSGDPTHAVAKAAILATGVPPVDDLSLGRDQSTAPAPVTEERAAFARRVWESTPGGALYARVDTVRLDDGGLAVLEVEMVEPYLFLVHTPDAAPKIASAVGRWLTGTAGP